MGAKAGDTRAALKAVATGLVRKDLARNVQVGTGCTCLSHGPGLCAPPRCTHHQGRLLKLMKLEIDKSHQTHGDCLSVLPCWAQSSTGTVSHNNKA